jgi:hypothetical protein
VLSRNPADFVQQNRFGGSDAPAGERGNCMQACLANVLGVHIDDVPHFYDTDEDEVQQGAAISAWCAERGWLCAYLTSEWLRCPWVVFPADALLILSGTSPRCAAWSHVVVGHVTQDGWRLVHDPHPSNAGIVGDPTGAYLLARLPARYSGCGEGATDVV